MIPRTDYLDLAARLPAQIIDESIYDRLPYRAFAPFDRISRLALGYALSAIRQLDGATTVLSMNEDIGVPVALLLGVHASGQRPRPHHVLIGHSLLAPAKVLLYRALRVMRRFDRILLMDSDAPTAVAAAYQLPPERVQFLPNAVDRAFWRPQPSVPTDPARVFSMGRARRDYRTLFEAVRNLPIALDIHAGSQWHVAYAPGIEGAPSNTVMTTDDLTPVVVRDRIARAAFVIIPLEAGAHSSAGSVTLLEAMAMGKPVVVAAGDGNSNLVIHGETGLAVPAGDVAALRTAMLTLVADPALAASMGARAAQWVAQHADHDDRVELLARHLRGVDDGASLPMAG